MNGRVSAQSRLAPQPQGNTLVFIPLPLNTFPPSSEPSAEDLRLARRLKGRARGDAALDYLKVWRWRLGEKGGVGLVVRCLGLLALRS